MKKQLIGFDRELALDWLDLTAGLIQQGLAIEQIRAELLRQLAGQIPGAEACRKTVTLLTRLWVRVPPEHQPLQVEAQQLLPIVLPEERLWLHWGMSLLAYPFFYEGVGTIGGLLRLQEAFEPIQLRQRIRERWGQRTTVDRALSRLVQTLATWEIIQETGEDRLYRPTPVRQTTNPALALWLLECFIRSACQPDRGNGQQLPLTQLVQAPALFPFDLTPHLANLHRSPRFEISHQGLDLEMVALAY